MPKPQEIQDRYQKALDDLVAKVEQDRNVLAAILFGSMSYDQVWERSDIDLWLIMRDGKRKYSDCCLSENGVIIHAQLMPRNEFKRRLEGSQQGGWLDFTFSRSTLLFTKDESIEAWYRDIDRIGARDRDVQLLRTTINALSMYAKAEKWFHLKKDYHYSFLWITYVVDRLAAVETLLHDEAPGREVVYQALAHNPEFFNAVYIDLVDRKKTRKNVGDALRRIDAYLEERAFRLFKPIIEFLEEANSMRTISEMEDHFAKSKIGGLDFACEWLAEKGIVEKMSAPMLLTEKSRVQVEEAAYFYDGEGVVW
ncbi:MAG: nucleotidyltransferase domain-containing protein [Gemmatimonadetes bacterium]|jgi:uncharacterized protein|nr:nucleotidyltransferase domain-containing protein [Gemmatimonadota bacterium]